MNAAKITTRREGAKARRREDAKAIALPPFSCFRAFRAFALSCSMMAMLCLSCHRRPIEYEETGERARIWVSIDWSHSGLNAPLDEQNRVYHASLRFFPKDGSPAFDRYITEHNATDGWIDVPVGQYAVVAFNESLQDVIYWSDAITFTGTESYTDFAAHAVAYTTPAAWAEEFPFYTDAGESVIIGPEPRRLASWSLDHFEVTEHMTRSSSALTPYEEAMCGAFTDIPMRRLTRMVNVTAEVTNLVSIQTHYCALSGFASTVYMASGETVQSPSVKLFTLNGKTPDPDHPQNGTVKRSFLSFGRVPESPSEAYTLSVDVLYSTGEVLKPTFHFPVTNDVLSSTGPDIDIHVDYAVDYREGGIAVDDWGDDDDYRID